MPYQPKTDQLLFGYLVIERGVNPLRFTHHTSETSTPKPGLTEEDVLPISPPEADFAEGKHDLRPVELLPLDPGRCYYHYLTSLSERS